MQLLSISSQWKRTNIYIYMIQVEVIITYIIRIITCHNVPIKSSQKILVFCCDIENWKPNKAKWMKKMKQYPLRWGRGLNVIKNWDPLVSGPAFAMDSTPGSSWISLKFSSVQQWWNARKLQQRLNRTVNDTTN